MIFYDLQSKTKSNKIDTIFPNWSESNERVVIFSPHDDDVILGTAYLLLATLENKGDVYVVIFNDGSSGYSKPDLKDQIVEIRKKETIDALQTLGVDEQHIIRFELPDFTGIHYLGWKLPWKNKDDDDSEGLFTKIVSKLREIKATRLIFPNGYHEHIDHTAACLSAMFDGPQVGDAVIVDYGKPSKIISFMQYCVWARLSPEDAILRGRNPDIRANKAIVVDKNIENKIIESLKEFKTQQEIISDILNNRKEREISDGKFIEVYLEVDPRPKLDYDPYKELIREIDK